MTSRPFSSNVTASEHPSPRQSRRTHHDSVSVNPHLQVLGRDGRDLPLFEEHHHHQHHHDPFPAATTGCTTRNTTPPKDDETTSTAPSKKLKQWWTNVWNTHSHGKEDGNDNNNDNNNITIYASLEETEADTAATPLSKSSSHSHVSSQSVRELFTDTTRQRTLPETTRLSPTCSDAAAAAAAATTAATTTSSSHYYTSAFEEIDDKETEEDRVRQDCSFFYRNIDEVTNNMSPSLLGNMICSSSSLKLLPPKQQLAYRARYQQLNQELLVPQEDEDLELYDESTTTTLDRTTTTTTTKRDDNNSNEAPTTRLYYPSMSSSSNNNHLSHNSSLYYRQDGRVLMKLPRDKVRLVMDPEWGEPGILSAIVDPHNDKNIFYILTVQPDLYKKVILDLASPSCTTQDRISMHVAVFLLVAILLILFVITLIYPGD